jgi:error-prone DNA polymerase
MKVDVLALGMLTCIRKCFDLIADHKGERYELATIPQDQKPVYDMLCRGESLGVFQVESRAQMNMLPRLKPRKFYDLVIEVAIVRPGPIQGDMVHPYLRRRNGQEEVSYPSPSPAHGDKDELRRVLHKTLGVPLFQEQAMRIAIEAAKFTSEEANGLRRAMATFRNVGTIGKFESKMVNNMIARGYDPQFAKSCFDQIKGFGSYGFPESHAASFAQLVYVSSWLKHFHPDAFCCGLLNSQPMGFYAPAQIVGDARNNGVEVREIDVSFSHAQNTLEEQCGKYHAVRLGFRQIDGFKWVDPDEEGLKLIQSSFRGTRSVNPESRDSGSGPSDHPGMTANNSRGNT